MPISTIANQSPRQNHPLPGRAQPALGQPLGDDPVGVDLCFRLIHEFTMTP
jgi:hypothetical protein